MKSRGGVKNAPLCTFVLKSIRPSGRCECSPLGPRKETLSTLMALDQVRLAEFEGQDPGWHQYWSRGYKLFIFLHIILHKIKVCLLYLEWLNNTILLEKHAWDISESNELHSAFTNRHSPSSHPLFQPPTISQRMYTGTATVRWRVTYKVSIFTWS